MKLQIQPSGLAASLGSPLRFRPGWKDVFLCLLSLLIWGGLVLGRDSTIGTRCITSPASCTKESVPAIDQMSLGLENGDADGFSFLTQNISGGLAVAGIVGWNLIAPQAGALSAIAADLSILIQSVAWNGVGTEVSHFGGRPRPFVYENPKERGANPAHYTSFWSGHTSFAAAAMVALLLALIRRRAPDWLLLLSGAAGQTLILSTAVFRIFAGRHFLTDVVCGALAGGFFALYVAIANSRRS